jgi:hypothetical protein
MFEVISSVNDQKLVKAHQHTHNTRNRNFNPSQAHNLKFECKPEYIGLKLLSQLPPWVKTNRRLEDIQSRAQETPCKSVPVPVPLLPNLA